MAWYEILIIIAAVIIVAIPIVMHFVNKKRGKHSCDCGGDCCSCAGCAHAQQKPKKDNKKV